MATETIGGSQPTLSRVVSRWEVVALSFNDVVGSGVYLRRLPPRCGREERLVHLGMRRLQSQSRAGWLALVLQPSW